MTIEEAEEFLNACEREELRDHAFGDVEIYWMKDGDEAARGHFGSTDFSVSIYPMESSFKGAEAQRLRNCGTLKKVERNDETGPDEYKEGQTMKGLSLGDVLMEMTRKT